MKPPGVGKHINEKYRILFQAISKGVEVYGVSGMEFILKNHFGTYQIIESESTSPLTILYNNTKSLIDKYGIDYVIYLIQEKNGGWDKTFTKISQDFSEVRHTKTLNEKIFEIISKAFNISIKDITEASFSKERARDGIRIYASGTAIKLFQDVLGYTTEDVLDLIHKSQQVISRHKHLIGYLDHKHPVDKPILKKYLHCKRELINFILDNNG